MRRDELLVSLKRKYIFLNKLAFENHLCWIKSTLIERKVPEKRSQQTPEEQTTVDAAGVKLLFFPCFFLLNVCSSSEQMVGSVSNYGECLIQLIAHDSFVIGIQQ